MGKFSLKQLAGVISQFNNDTGWGAHWLLIAEYMEKLIIQEADDHELVQTAHNLKETCEQLEQQRRELLKLLKSRNERSLSEPIVPGE